MALGPSATDRMSWEGITRRAGPCWKKRLGGGRLWKSRSVENQKQVFPCAWESRNPGGIPTFPQPRRLRSLTPMGNGNGETDISLAKKTGHFNLLRTSSNPEAFRARRPAGLFHVRKPSPD